MFYFLDVDGRTPVKCNQNGWLIFRNSPSHMIANHTIGEVSIVTTFTGLDEYYLENTPAFIFATFVTGGVNDGEEMRYADYDEALTGHDKLCQWVLSHEARH